MRIPRLITVLTLLGVATACSGTDTTASTSAADDSPAASSTPTAVDKPVQETGVTSIRITIAGQTMTARLADNPTARDLADQLPMTLSFKDLNRLEKIATLPRPLTTDGTPDGADPQVADLGYYAPSQDLVLYYGDVGYYSGIVRIGQFDSSQTEFIENQPDGFQVTIQRG